MTNCRLVQIEVRDFKSFGGSHLIGPFEHFTGIVGPNGSGKSNVLDSLAFVFYLDRNPRSTSYIHSVIGSPRVDDCSVKVTLEEEEGKKKKKAVQHTYERVYNYEDKSILYIDEKEVDEEKYKEVISSKGFIPLIFVKQAEVDLIARKTPIELTQLFEEISGSKEFAKRYDELRIESEAAHEAVLMIEKRRRTAISERKHISGRKEEAARFRQLQKEEEKIQIESSIFQLFHMNKQIRQLDEKIAALKEENVKLITESDEANEELKRIEHDKLSTSNKLVEIEEEYKEVEQEKREANANKINFSERQAMISEQLNDAKTKLEQTSDAEIKRDTDLQNYRDECEMIKQELEKLPKVEKLEKDIQEYTNLREQASQQFDDITQALKKAMKERNLVYREINEMKDQYQSLQASKERKEDLIEQCKVNQQKEESRYKNIFTDIENYEGDKKLKEEKNKDDINKQKEMMRQLQDLEKKCDEIRRIEGSDKRKEKFNKLLTRMKTIIPGVYGQFSKLVRISHPKYEEAALKGWGGYADAIVVQDRETGIRCIQFLKEGGHGDVRLLPLNDLKPKKVTPKKGVLLLSNVMNYDPSIKNAVQFVCGHIAVVSSDKEANRLAFDDHMTVVTEDGKIFDPRGMITGGTSRNKPRLNTESLSDLEDRKAKLEEKLGTIGNEISKRKSELEDIDDKLFTLRPQLSYRLNKIDDLKKRIESMQTDIRYIDRQIKELTEKVEKKNKELSEKDEEIEKINFTQSENDKRIFKDFCKRVNVSDVKEFEITLLQDFDERYSKRLEYNSRLSQLDALITDIQNQNAQETTKKYRSQLDEFQQQLDEVTRQVEFYTAKDEQLQNQLNEIKAKRKEILDEDKSNRSEAKDKRKICQEYTEKLEKNTDDTNNAKHEMKTAMAVVRSVLQQCKLSNVELPKINKTKRGKKSKKNDDDEELVDEIIEADEAELLDTPSSFTQENLDKRELDEIDFKSLTAAQRNMPIEDVKSQTKQYEKELEEVRSRIKQIRPDLKSDDRYTKVEEELGKISTDQEKLRQEAARTKKEFIEVKTKRRDLFMQLYEKVDQHIDRIYKELTRVRNQENRSGTAYLALEDTEEPYLGGIKYTAMPPHKRFRDLEQLSGGEKAVASLALVIALQKNTEAPFIMMDEPDASLDKLNLRAAADALSKISKNTQIVSVSLRDRFFEHSDALVGIYKDKNSQSSNVLTLNLKQFDDQTLEMDALE